MFLNIWDLKVGIIRQKAYVYEVFSRNSEHNYMPYTSEGYTLKSEHSPIYVEILDLNLYLVTSHILMARYNRKKYIWDINSVKLSRLYCNERLFNIGLMNSIAG